MNASMFGLIQLPMSKIDNIRMLLMLAVAGTTGSASAVVLQDFSASGNRPNAPISLEEKENFNNATQSSWENPASDSPWLNFQRSGLAGLENPESRVALASTSAPIDIILNNNEDFVLSGGPGETVTLNLRNFMLRDASTLTLEGTATTSFIINVTKKFALTGSARIVLSGGVQEQNVFFNVLGTGTQPLLKKNTILFGTLTATYRDVLLSGHSIVYGKVVAEGVRLKGAAQIIPPVVSQ